MPMPNEDFASTGGINPATFANELFGAPSTGSEEPAHSEGGAPAISSDGATPPAGSSTPPNGSGISQESWDALPKSWKKDMEAQWKTLAPEVRKYVHERETHVNEGISRYRSAHDRWNQATAPFAALMAQYPDANPAEILATIAQNHVMMLQATPQERVQHAIALARGYGVELTPKQAQQAIKDASAAGGQGAATQDGFTPAQIEALRQMLAPILGPVRQTTEFVNKQISASAQKEVDDFFSDPKNEFAADVEADILKILQQGGAQNLGEAYMFAVLRNPEVKARYFAKLAADSAPPKPAASQLPNVKSSATPVKSGKPQTMDDTMQAVLNKHYPKS